MPSFKSGKSQKKAKKRSTVNSVLTPSNKERRASLRKAARRHIVHTTEAAVNKSRQQEFTKRSKVKAKARKKPRTFSQGVASGITRKDPISGATVPEQVEVLRQIGVEEKQLNKKAKKFFGFLEN